MNSQKVKQLSFECGFELAGVASAIPVDHRFRYREWVEAGYAGAMGYLTDHRAGLRDHPRMLLPSARSILCVGKLYNGPEAHSKEFSSADCGWISRYAWGEDYHNVMRRQLAAVVEQLREQTSQPFEHRICIDTAPLLERSYAAEAGLGWIGKNTCLINQQQGSWFFLGELLLSLELQPDSPPPDRCGTCTRCIDACPTAAILPGGTLDARLCISYFTIELRGPVPEEHRAGIGNHVFGCDICQEVCPWNGRAPVDRDVAFAPRVVAPPLERMAVVQEEEFRAMFRDTPVSRARYSGFLRNVAIAMGNARLPQFRAPLEKLARSADAVVAEHAQWALAQLP